MTWRNIFRDAGWLVPRDLPPEEERHLKFISEIGEQYLRAYIDLAQAGIDPYRVDQYNEIVRLAQLMKLSGETCASMFGFLNGAHIFEDRKTERLLSLRGARGFAIFRLHVGPATVPYRVSKGSCLTMVTHGQMI